MRCGAAWPVLALLTPLLGCDPTAGLSDTADAALPSVKRYFDGPGQKLADGPWNRVVVDLDADTLYHVGARRLDDEEPTFHVFGADQRDGCSVSPNAGTWLMGKPDDAPFRLLPYLEEIDRGRGRMRFMTLDCEVQEIAIENARRPYPRLFENGYLVPTGAGYTFVDPWAGESRSVVGDLQDSLVWDSRVVFWADDKLKSFDDAFELSSEVGEGVLSVVDVGESFLVEDETGLSRVDFDRDTLELTSTPVLEGACNLQVSRSASLDDEGAAWVSLALPCESPRPSLLRLDVETFEVLEQLELPFEADARRGRAVLGSVAEDDESTPVSYAYLSEVDEAGFGPVWIYQLGSEAPLQLGDRGDADAVFFESSDSAWDGLAQVNYQSINGRWAHDWLHFRWDGTTELIAERVVRNSSNGELLVNFDGVSGDLPMFSDEGVSIVAEKVPLNVGEVSSFTKPQRFARMDQYDGQTGQVLLSNEFDRPSLWDAVAQGVTPDSLRFVWFMPAIMFLENWDPETETGDLVAYNYELDARATISAGVSSFDLTRYPWDGVVYSVPYGKRQGVWFSKAK